MNDAEARTYEMLARVRDFGAGHATAFPPGTLAAALFAQVGAAVRQLSPREPAGGAATRRLARERLRADLQAVQRTARAMSLGEPDAAGRFRLPATDDDRALLDAALAFAAGAVALRAAFARHGLTEAFFAKLEADAAALEHALVAPRREGGETAEGALAAGVRAVRQLDGVVRHRFAADPLVLMSWGAATRTNRIVREPAETAGRSRT
jgi:hypothetical protein